MLPILMIVVPLSASDIEVSLTPHGFFNDKFTLLEAED